MSIVCRCSVPFVAFGTAVESAIINLLGKYMSNQAPKCLRPLKHNSNAAHQVVRLAKFIIVLVVLAMSKFGET